ALPGVDGLPGGRINSGLDRVAMGVVGVVYCMVQRIAHINKMELAVIGGGGLVIIGVDDCREVVVAVVLVRGSVVSRIGQRDHMVLAVICLGGLVAQGVYQCNFALLLIEVMDGLAGIVLFYVHVAGEV